MKMQRFFHKGNPISYLYSPTLYCKRKKLLKEKNKGVENKIALYNSQYIFNIYFKYLFPQ